MARISFSALVEEIIGKLAGSVFQDSYGGLQVRTRVSPRNPQSKYQQLRRGEFAFLSASWRNLTAIQRQTFIDAASTPPAALNLFLQSNINLTLVNEPTIDTYVPSSDPGSMTVEFIEATNESMLIQATGSPLVVPAGTKLLVQVTYPKAPTKIFTNPSQYSPVISFDEGTDLSIPTDIFSEWQSRYGQLTLNKRLCLKASLIDKSNGLRGADSINCTITEEMAKFVKIFTDVTQPQTTGTGSNQLTTFNVPANTLTQNGEIIYCHFAGKSSGGSTGYSVTPAFNGTGIGWPTFNGNADWIATLRIQRISSNGAYIAATFTVNLTTYNEAVLVDNSMDWTAAIAIDLNAQAPNAGSVLMNMCDINKELI